MAMDSVMAPGEDFLPGSEHLSTQPGWVPFLGGLGISARRSPCWWVSFLKRRDKSENF
jgi:hypothetical protein